MEDAAFSEHGAEPDCGAPGVSSVGIRLADGQTIPVFGLGVYCSNPGRTTENAVLAALRAGYRLIDTAALYRNEESVGAAIRQSGLQRHEVFVVTKLWNDCHGGRRTLQAGRDSLRRLGIDYIDLYLIHSPIGGRLVETWDAMLQLRAEGLVKSVGVSNFGVHHLEGLRKAGREAPTVNQLELHPFLQQREVVLYCQQRNIALMGYSPLARAEMMGDRTIASIAERYNRTPAQVMIRWGLQHSFITIPKSVHEARIYENAGVFNWELLEEDMVCLDGLDCGHRTCWNPLKEPWDP